MPQHSIAHLLEPSAVALFGLHSCQDRVSQALFHNLIQGAPTIPLYVVDAELNSVAELPCVRSAAELPKAIDLAIIAGDQPFITSTLIECRAQGITSAMVTHPSLHHQQGESQQVAQSILEVARREGIRLLGPDCFGLCLPRKQFYPWLGNALPKSGHLALISHSGAIASAVVDWANGQGIGFAQIVALGSSSDITLHELLDRVTNDLFSRSIMLYLEHIDQVRPLLSSLRAAARVKPVIVLTTADQECDDRILNAALRRAGVIRGHRLNDLVAAAAILSTGKRLRPGKLMMISSGIGPARLAQERAKDLNISLLDPAEKTREELSQLLPASTIVENPLALFDDNDLETLAESIRITNNDPECNAVMVLLSPTALNRPDKIAQTLIDLAKSQRKPILAVWLGGGSDLIKIRARMNEAGIPCFRTPESAVEGYSFLYHFQLNQQLLLQTPGSRPFGRKIDIEQAHALINHWLAQGQTSLPHGALEELLGCFDIELQACDHTPSSDAIPLHLRLCRDPVFGPVIGLSVGGNRDWLLRNEAFALPPLNETLARDLIEQVIPTQTSSALEKMLVHLSALCCECPQVGELEIAPLWLSDQQLCFVNGSLSLIPKLPIDPSGDRSRYRHLAIHPYPRQWVTPFTLRSGEQVTVRPIRPEDAEMEQQFIRALSSEARYFRFMENLKELPPSLLARFTQIDYDREMALIAEIRDAGETREIAVARYTNIADSDYCEFAIVLDDQWQGSGLARYMMEQLFDIAAQRGIPFMEGHVLAENRKMIQFCRKLGFSIARDPEDPTVVIARRALQ